MSFTKDATILTSYTLCLAYLPLLVRRQLTWKNYCPLVNKNDIVIVSVGSATIFRIHNWSFIITYSYVNENYSLCS
jgi:hypothetical protein